MIQLDYVLGLLRASDIDKNAVKWSVSLVLIVDHMVGTAGVLICESGGTLTAFGDGGGDRRGGGLGSSSRGKLV